MNLVDSTKRYVVDDRWRLRLFDCIAGETRRLSAALKDPQFSASSSWSDDEFRRRVAWLDELLADMYHSEALMGRWGSPATLQSLTLAPKRLSDGAGEGGGNTGFLALQWYPSLALSYAGGIAAVAAESYASLVALMHARVGTSRGEMRLVEAATRGIGDRRQHFKLLPGHERHHVPFSEYLYQRLMPLLDQALCLGSAYDGVFDTFEILYSVEFSYQSGRGWGPLGRFAWKARSGSSPLPQIIEEAAGAGKAWPPVAAGLCGGSPEKFAEHAKSLSEAVARSGMW
ncbi:MAG: hypothetical protein WC815_17790 [Vicinamibacterales bacterium]|jgi:hypothetical protein